MARRGLDRCSEPGCQRPAHSRSLCNTHYSQHRKAGTLAQFPNANEAAKAAPTRQRPRPAQRRLWSSDTCQEDDCDAPPIARNLCGKHYQRAMLGGNPPPKIRVRLEGTTCEVPACDQKAVARHRCQSHASLARRYGLTTEQMAGLSTECQACGSTARLHVDHDHPSETYRGVLCANCNTALGLLGDNPQRLRALISYLER